MNTKQISKSEIEISKTEGDKVFKRYFMIDSEEGQKLIKENNIEIDPEMKDL